jgi:hypothetical protein
MAARTEDTMNAAAHYVCLRAKLGICKQCFGTLGHTKRAKWPPENFGARCQSLIAALFSAVKEYAVAFVADY